MAGRTNMEVDQNKRSCCIAFWSLPGLKDLTDVLGHTPIEKPTHQRSLEGK